MGKNLFLSEFQWEFQTMLGMGVWARVGKFLTNNAWNGGWGIGGGNFSGNFRQPIFGMGGGGQGGIPVGILSNNTSGTLYIQTVLAIDMGCCKCFF